MQSVTSCFNKTLFRHNLAQFWPLWFGYTLLWLFLLPIRLFTEYPAPDTITSEVLNFGVYGGLGMGFCFSLLFAMAMFSSLCIPRATLGLHALPARREALFVTSFLAGLFCLLTTLAVTFALTGAVAAGLGQWDAGALLTALLAAALNAVFFYSFAVLCMVMTGQLLAAPVFYAVGNFLAVGMEMLLRAFAGNFLFGYSYSSRIALGFLSPAYCIASRVDVNVEYEDVFNAAGDWVDSVMTGWEVTGLSVLAAYAAAGLVLAALSLWLCRCRKSEMTGSVVAFSWAKPLFKYGVAFCTAVSLGQLVYYILFGQNRRDGDASLAGTLACMVVCGLLGYYAAEMLLKKSVRIFKSSLRGAAVTAAVLVVLGVSMSSDLTGYERRIPEAEEIESAYISFGSTSFTTEESEELAKILSVHRAVIAHKDELRERAQSYYGSTLSADGDTDMLYLSLDYTLKDGSALSRSYDVVISRAELREAGSAAQAINEVYTGKSAVLSRTLDWHGTDALPNADALRFTGGYCNIFEARADGTSFDATLTAAQAEQLYAAALRDAEGIYAAQSDIFSDSRLACSAWIELYAGYTGENGAHQETTYSLEVRGDMTETLALLRQIEQTKANEARY